MITDLVQIRLLGEKKRGENLRFRRHMKSHHHSDRILRRIAEDIEGQIDCRECGNCCKVATAKVNERDIERLSRELRIPAAKVITDFTAEPLAGRHAASGRPACSNHSATRSSCVTGESAEEGRILRRSEETGCVFLQGTECSVYEARPDSCRRFPHVVRGNGSIASRMWEFVDRACYCPIVYNSLEAFKEELGFQR
jgi:Fe-S-cluster containining protein